VAFEFEGEVLLVVLVPLPVPLPTPVPVLLVVLPVEDAPVAATVDPPGVVNVAALTTGATAIVVVDVGRLGVTSFASASQVSINAGKTPGTYAA